MSLKKHVAAIYLQNSVQMWMGYSQQVVNFSNQTVLLEKRLNFISGYAMRLVRAPSHCSSQLHSRIVGNLTKNYSSQPEQGPGWNPWNIRLLLLLIYIELKPELELVLGSRADQCWLRRHSPPLYYSNSYLATDPCTHTLTTVWLPFGPHFRHVYLKI